MNYFIIAYRFIILAILIIFILFSMQVEIFFKKLSFKGDKKKISDYIDSRINVWASKLMKAGFKYINFNLDIKNEVGELPEKFVIVSNHQSFIDVLVMFIAFKERKLRFIAKRVLESPFTMGVSAVLTNQNNALIDRKKNVKETFLKIKEMSVKAEEENSCIIVFPEGTRSRTGEISPFKRGAFEVILKNTTMPLVCVTLDGGYKLSHITKLVTGEKNKSTDYKLVIGKIIPVQDRERMSLDEVISECKDHISLTLNRIREA